MTIGTWVGYPRSYTKGRNRGIQYVVIHHTAGSEGPTSAENGAAYDKRRTDGTSCHAFADSNSVPVEVPDGDRAHAARYHGNEVGLQLELCGTLQTRAQWLDAVSLATLRNGAAWTAEKCKAYGLPVRRLTVAETRAAYYGAQGARPKGIVGHVDCTKAYPEDGGDHTDPGPAFPWDVFLAMVAEELAKLNGTVETMAKLVKVDDGPGGPGAVYGSGGGVRRGFKGWDAAVAWAAFWKCPTSGLETIPWARVDELLGPDIADLKASAGGLVAHTHSVDLPSHVDRFDTGAAVADDD